MGHPNLEIRMPSKMLNTIRQSVQRPHSSVVPSSMLGRLILSRLKAPQSSAIIYAWTPKSSPGAKGPRTRLAHGPTPKYGWSEASQAVEQSPSRPRPPRRGPRRRVSSPPLPRVGGYPRRTSEFHPRPSPPQGLGPRGNSASFEAPLCKLGL